MVNCSFSNKMYSWGRKDYRREISFELLLKFHAPDVREHSGLWEGEKRKMKKMYTSFKPFKYISGRFLWKYDDVIKLSWCSLIYIEKVYYLYFKDKINFQVPAVAGKKRGRRPGHRERDREAAGGRETEREGGREAGGRRPPGVPVLFSFETFDLFILLFYFALYGRSQARGRQFILRRCSHSFRSLSFFSRESGLLR